MREQDISSVCLLLPSVPGQAGPVLAGETHDQAQEMATKP